MYQVRNEPPTDISSTFYKLVICNINLNCCTSRLGAATLFAATEARSCFPCFDEPNFKAIFALEVTVDSDLMVISNMPLMDSEAVTSSSSQTRKKRRDIFE